MHIYAQGYAISSTGTTPGDKPNLRYWQQQQPACVPIAQPSHDAKCMHACRNVQDHTLPAAVQLTSVRLLLNLVEVIFSKRHTSLQQQPRAFLHTMLLAFTMKLSALRKAIPRLLASAERARLVRDAPPPPPPPSLENFNT